MAGRALSCKAAASRYRGSADAVRRNLPVVLEPYRGTAVPDDLLILSGQALYRMVLPQEARGQGFYSATQPIPNLLSGACRRVLRTQALLHQSVCSVPGFTEPGPCFSAPATPTRLQQRLKAFHRTCSPRPAARLR